MMAMDEDGHRRLRRRRRMRVQPGTQCVGIGQEIRRARQIDALARPGTRRRQPDQRVGRSMAVETARGQRQRSPHVRFATVTQIIDQRIATRFGRDPDLRRTAADFAEQVGQQRLRRRMRRIDPDHVGRTDRFAQTLPGERSLTGRQRQRVIDMPELPAGRLGQSGHQCRPCRRRDVGGHP